MSLIPFNRPNVLGDELALIEQILRDRHLSGDGAATRACHRVLEQVSGGTKALLTTSCTHALEMAALLLNLGPGDEVIVPSFTFVSTVNAFVLRGARPVFADVRPDTLNLDEKQLPRLVSKRTRAIVPVHYAGVACEMDEINAVAKESGIAVVEDAAHALMGSYKGRPVGSLGVMSTFSFHETKNFTCGEGGALVLNRADLCERAEIVREKGTNRSRFFRGEVDKYGWVDVGSSYLPSEILAGYLLAQLMRREDIQAKRAAIWNRYARELRDWAEKQDIRLPFVPPHVGQAYHMFYLLMPSLDVRTRFIAHVREGGAHAVFHYLPLHRSEMAKQWGGESAACPVTEEVSDRLVRLPFFTQMLPEEQDRVLDAVLRFRV
jgi:dTDP-4-amino-4,6-dideoxygalactose transaminase